MVCCTATLRGLSPIRNTTLSDSPSKGNCRASYSVVFLSLPLSPMPVSSVSSYAEVSLLSVYPTTDGCSAVPTALSQVSRSVPHSTDWSLRRNRVPATAPRLSNIRFSLLLLQAAPFRPSLSEAKGVPDGLPYRWGSMEILLSELYRSVSCNPATSRLYTKTVLPYLFHCRLLCIRTNTVLRLSPLHLLRHSARPDRYSCGSLSRLSRFAIRATLPVRPSCGGILSRLLRSSVPNRQCDIDVRRSLPRTSPVSVLLC